jgi:hypothetical protein
VDTQTQFEFEAELLSQLQHENIVRLLQFGVSNERAFIVMELGKGKTLNYQSLRRKHFSRSIGTRDIGSCWGLSSHHVFDDYEWPRAISALVTIRANMGVRRAHIKNHLVRNYCGERPRGCNRFTFKISGKKTGST